MKELKSNANYKYRNTRHEVCSNYLTEEELQKKETKDLVKKYKQEKYSVAIFVSGKENYPEILEKIITKQVGLNRNVC